MTLKRLSAVLGAVAVAFGAATTAGMAGASAQPAPAAPAPAFSAACGHQVGPHCLAIVNHQASLQSEAAMAKGGAPQGLTPADIQAAYNLKGGKPGTVALIESGDYQNIDSDLQTYRKQFGLPECSKANGCLQVLNQDGKPGPLPAPDNDWATETALDVDAVSAACPSCKIQVIEVNEPQDPNDVHGLIKNLSSGNDAAANLKANAASNSWGDKGDGEKFYQEMAPSYNHPGTAITVSSGDDGNGGGVTVPSSYPTVTAVGGTSLKKDSNQRGWTETAWEGAGSGCSQTADLPPWQTKAVTACNGKRGLTDVSAVADPKTGLAVFGPSKDGGSQWQVVGGTSLSSPLVAAIYAMAGDTDSVKDASKAYANADKLNDVTQGQNGDCQGPVCHAGQGWDGPTGLGTPNGLGAF